MLNFTYAQRKPSIIGLGLALVIASGCGPGRQAQCQALGTATQEVMSQVEAVYQSQIGKNAYDPEFERQLANVWESGFDRVEAVDLQDRELQSIRDDLATAYQKAADTRRQVAEITPADGLPSSEAEAEIDALTLQSEAGIPPAINELNLYCLGG